MKKLIFPALMLVTSAALANSNSLVGTYKASGECTGLFSDVTEVTIENLGNDQAIDTMRINAYAPERSMNYLFGIGNATREIKFEGGSYLEAVKTKVRNGQLISRTVFSNPVTESVTMTSTVKAKTIGNEIELQILAEHATGRSDASSCLISK